MSILIPTGFAQVLLPFQHASLARAAVITYGLDVDAAGGDFITVADEQPVIFTNAWTAELADDVTVGPATMRVGQDGGDPLAVLGTNTDTGSEGAAMLPPNVALLVKKLSSTGGRRGRGRLYIPWVTQEAAVDDVGVLDGGSLSARQDAAEDWLVDLQAGTTGTYSTPMVILHDSSGAGPEPAPSVVTSLLVDPMVATQRRRLGR